MHQLGICRQLSKEHTQVDFFHDVRCEKRGQEGKTDGSLNELLGNNESSGRDESRNQSDEGQLVQRHVIKNTGFETLKNSR